MLLTYEMLRAKNACAAQADKFRALFPRGVILTEALCIAHASDFDFDWAARKLLGATSWEAYETACVAAWDACETACATAWGGAYKKARAPARDACETACAAAWEAYEKARAAAFFACWQLDHAP